MQGTLFLVATPIGNLDDITRRAIEILSSVDIVACEDTRRTEKLIHHLGLHKSLMRYDEHTHHQASRKIQEYLKIGKSVALVTDAGTPAISDPGSRLVHDVVAAGGKVIPIPGACSPIAALSASGFVGEGFIFLGFLPRKAGPAKRALQEALGLGKTVVILESPFRAVDTLEALATLAPGAHVVVARELTKIHEEFLRGPVEHVHDQLKTRPEKGEIVILVRPGTPIPETV